MWVDSRTSYFMTANEGPKKANHYRDQFRKCFENGTATEQGSLKPLKCGISGDICSSKRCPLLPLGYRLYRSRISALIRAGLK